MWTTISASLISAADCYTEDVVIMDKMQIKKRFDEMTTPADLRRNKLTLSDYYELLDVLVEVLNGSGEALTFISGVADWCRRAGLKVINHDEIHYAISVN